MQQDSLEHVGYTIRIMWGTDLFYNYIGVDPGACKWVRTLSGWSNEACRDIESAGVVYV